MNYNAPMRKECLTLNADGSYTVKGGGWFWVRMNSAGSVLEMAPGMAEKKAARLFISQAKLTVQKYACEGCGKIIVEDAYRGCCSFNCYCLWSCIP